MSQTQLTSLIRQVLRDEIQKGGVRTDSPIRKLIREEIRKKDNEWVDVGSQIGENVVQVITAAQLFNWTTPTIKPIPVSLTGSGFFVMEQGVHVIITNYHVIANSLSAYIRIPVYGKERFETKLIGYGPNRDVAFLILTDEAKKKLIKLRKDIHNIEGPLSFVRLGDSSKLEKNQPIMAIGFPLGKSSSTLGSINGEETINGFAFLKSSAPIAPGSSGGGTFTKDGFVIGINTQARPDFDNQGLMIPINQVKPILRFVVSNWKRTRKVGIVRTHTLGGILQPTTKNISSYYKLPSQGGVIVARVFENSLLKRNGIQKRDILYKVDGYTIDKFGEIKYKTGLRNRITFREYLNLKQVGDKVRFLIHRNGGTKIRKEIIFQDDLKPIRRIYPIHERKEIESFAYGGMTIMNLKLNHVNALIAKELIQGPYRNLPDHFTYLLKYQKEENQDKKLVVIVNIQPGSEASFETALYPGAILGTVNERKVRTIDEFMEILKDAIQNKKPGLLIETKHELRPGMLTISYGQQEMM